MLQGGHLAKPGDIFGCHTIGGSRWGWLLASRGWESRNVAQHPTMHRTAPTANHQVQTVSGAGVEKPWSSGGKSQCKDLQQIRAGCSQNCSEPSGWRAGLGARVGGGGTENFGLIPVS